MHVRTEFRFVLGASRLTGCLTAIPDGEFETVRSRKRNSAQDKPRV